MERKSRTRKRISEVFQNLQSGVIKMFLENGLKGLVISLVTGIIGIVITYLFWWIYQKIKGG